MGDAFRTDGKTHVLVIDDEESVLSSVVAVLQLQNYAVHGVTSPEAALAYVRDRSPRILLIDVHLGSADGIEVAQRIARQVPGIRIIVMSGDPDAAAIMEHAQRDGLQFEILPKPTHPRELFSKLGAAD